MKRIIFALLSFAALFALSACAEPHIHQYGEWKITVDSTCSTEGVKERYCSECSEKQTKAVEKKNHLPGKWTIDTATGTRTEVCAVCGETMGTEALEYDDTTKLLYEVNPDGTTCTVTGFESIASPELIIPEKIDNFTVTKIGDLAFFDCRLIEKVVLPDTVTALGASAFNSCASLAEINLPEGLLTIGSYQFYNCRSLKEVTIPSTLTKLTKLSFGGCVSLESVSFTNGLVSIANNTFFNCRSLEEITLPETVTTLSASAFSTCTGLKKITVLGKLSSVGNRCFGSCESVEEFIMEENDKYYISGNCLVDSESKRLVAGFRNAQIPDGVKIIASGAFWGITGIKSLTLPAGVETIENDAFGKCFDLEEIIFPASLKELYGYVLYKDTNLKTVTYNGKMSDWEEMDKNPVWDLGTEDYVIKCIDGEIRKEK